MSRGKYTITWWRIISRKSLLLLNWRQLQYRSLKCLKFSNSNEIRDFLKTFKIWFRQFLQTLFSLSFWSDNKIISKYEMPIYKFAWCFRYLIPRDSYVNKHVWFSFLVQIFLEKKIKRNVNDISIFISLFQAIKQWYKHKQNPYFQKTKFTFLW